MSGGAELRDGDLRLMRAVIEEGRRGDPAEALPWAVLATLRQLIPCDINVSFQEHDLVQAQTMCQWVDDDGHFVERSEPGDPGMVEWLPYFWSTPCSYPQHSGDLRSVFHTGDFTALRQLLNQRPQPPHSPDEPAHDLVVSLPAGPGRARRVLFFRGPGPGFTERDRVVMTLLRPHLYEIWLEAERRRHGVPSLTPREWQVLHLAGAGCSNAEIARILTLSVGTVRKHFEHIYDRLGVRTRTAAAALALPHQQHANAVTDGRGGDALTRMAVRL